MTVIRLDEWRRNQKRKKPNQVCMKCEEGVSLQRTMRQVQFLGIATFFAGAVFLFTLAESVLKGRLFGTKFEGGNA